MGLLILSGVAFAQTGTSTSYSLTMQQDGHKLTSPSYGLCGVLPSVGSLGSSTSYGIMPYLPCSTVAAAPAACGNGIIDAGEVCDGGNLGVVTSCSDLGFSVGTPSCNASCTAIIGCSNPPPGGGGGGCSGLSCLGVSPVCGNNVLQAGEQCDDGNLVSGDGCSATCTIEAPQPQIVCGNGIVEASEQCDDGNTLPLDGCNSSCQVELVAPRVGAQCGNGIRQGSEQCDDGNLVSGDECSATCAIERPAAPEVEELIPAEIIPEPTPSVPPTPEQPDFIFITNDVTPLLFGKFVESEDFSVVFRGRDGLETLKISALDDFVSFETENDLENGIYDVFVTDLRNPLETAYLEIEVDTEEPILPPVIDMVEIHETETQEFVDVLEITDRTPVIQGHTEKAALIGIYSVADGSLKVVETDENNTFEFSPPRPLGFGEGEYRIVALYAGELSREVRIRYNVPAPCGSCVILGTVYPSWVCIALLLLALFSIVYVVLHSCMGCRELRDAERSGKCCKWFGFLVFMALLLQAPSAYAQEASEAMVSPEVEQQLIEVLSDGTTATAGALGIDTPDATCGFCVILHGEYPTWVCILLIFIVLYWIYFVVSHACRNGFRRRVRGVPHKAFQKDSKARRSLLGLFAVLLSLSLMAPYVSGVRAVETTPAFLVYNGILKDSGGSAVTTAQTFRFTLWTSDDFVTGVDRSAAGAILIGSATYAGWLETQTITPDSSGYFEIQVGTTSADPWPNFNKDAHPYLMIEVKPSASADTAYEVINPTGADDANDRHDIGSEPFARNSDYLDNKEIGTSADNLVLLDGSALFPTSTIPGGTNVDTFNIDADDPSDAVGVIGLYFGTTLADHVLSWDPDGVAAADGWFNFNDDVNVAGDLTVTGSITGSIAYSNLVPRTKSILLIPEYDGSVVEGDGTDNRGKLQIDFEDLGGIAKRNFYDWQTRQVALNDIDVVVKMEIPLDFVSFAATPFELAYQTSDGVIATNQVDVELYDTTGTAVTLVGATDLASGTWTTASITTGGVPTFTAGGEIAFRIRLFSTSSGFARISNLKINYTGR